MGNVGEPCITEFFIESLQLRLFYFLNKTEQVFRHLVDVFFSVPGVLG